MPGFLPDTSCMVAALCSWHEQHAAAAMAINRRLDAGEKLIIAAPALVETYAVLTRLPPPHRIAAADAFALLEANFMRTCRQVALNSTGYRRLLREAATGAVVGGRTYDAVIVGCAIRAGASVLLTFNGRDFLALTPASLAVVIPGMPD